MSPFLFPERKYGMLYAGGLRKCENITHFNRGRKKTFEVLIFVDRRPKTSNTEERQ
jgi:hypothetical protein